MKPIPESVEAAGLLRQPTPDLDLLAYLGDLADMVCAVVPGCSALTAAWLDLDLSFTLLADDEPSIVDKVSRPGVDPDRFPGPIAPGISSGISCGISSGSGGGELFDEEAWRRPSEVSEAALRVKSSLTIPLLGTSASVGVIGSVTLYADTADAFEGRHHALAAAVGGSASAAVRNADLSFSTRAESEQTPAVLDRYRTIATASMVLADQMSISVEDAVTRLAEVAEHTDTSVETIARIVVELKDR